MAHSSTAKAVVSCCQDELGIGPQGFGGMITALGIHIETYPTHIASLPLA
jgi:tartrate dehydratase alpha subunit/fumarate hydratase class I-like protein